MIGEKIAIFIDTNVFESNGFNFDSRNTIIEQYKNLLLQSNCFNVCVTVIDEEIKQHINKKIDEDKRAIKKHCKWINNYLKETDIKNNLEKNLNDYEKFKSDTKTVYLDLSSVAANDVIYKYFNKLPPFELKKPNEFKDAFFLETIYSYAKKHDTYAAFIVVSNDNGVKQAIVKQHNKKIISVDSIEKLIDSLIGYSNETKTSIHKYLMSYNFDKQIEELAEINITDIEEETIDVDSYCCTGVYFPKIISVSDDKVTLVCDLAIKLTGEFSCLDYDNSYYSNEEKQYLYTEYVERQDLSFVCQTVIEVEINDNKCISAQIVDLPEIEISFDSFR